MYAPLTFAAILAFAAPSLAADLTAFSDDQLLAMRNVCAQQHGGEDIMSCDPVKNKCVNTHRRSYADGFQQQCGELDDEAMRRIHVSPPPVPQHPGVVWNGPIGSPVGDGTANDAWFKEMLK